MLKNYNVEKIVIISDNLFILETADFDYIFMMLESRFKICFNDGDSIFFEDFFKENFVIFSSFAYRYIPNVDICEDIVQEAFLLFWERRDSFKSKVATKAFFYTSIRNTCLNNIKHSKVESKYLERKQFIEEPNDSFLDVVFEKEVYGEIYKEINKLPKMAQMVLRLTLRGKTNKEIANQLGIAINTVKVYKNRTFKILRKNLQDLYYFLLFFRNTVSS